MKKSVALGAVLFAVICTGCGSPEESAVSQSTDPSAKPAGGAKATAAGSPNVMGSPQLTEAGSSMQAGSKTK